MNGYFSYDADFVVEGLALLLGETFAPGELAARRLALALHPLVRSAQIRHLGLAEDSCGSDSEYLVGRSTVFAAWQVRGESDGSLRLSAVHEYLPSGFAFDPSLEDLPDAEAITEFLESLGEAWAPLRQGQWTLN